ncbi:MAG: hypothetical protein IPL80_13555 [Sterolibacteriaceae bacterium]|nr:hypothetical protein [Sterolibacteriaceae bacterium]
MTQMICAVRRIDPSPHCFSADLAQDRSRDRAQSAALDSSADLHAGMDCILSASKRSKTRCATI